MVESKNNYENSNVSNQIFKINNILAIPKYKDLLEFGKKKDLIIKIWSNPKNYSF